MWAAVVLAACAVASVAANVTANATEPYVLGRHMFFREMGEGQGAGGSAGGGLSTRRIFGGAAVELEEFPQVAVLLDRYWAARCSASAVAPHWVLTAGHCITSQLAYVKYNTRRPASPEGDFTPVHFLYRHPKYKVMQSEGEHADVRLLHHDVGLVRTRDAMRLRAALPTDLRVALRRYYPEDLFDQEVQVLGFGRTERSVLGEELFGARLRLVRCGRAGWLHCVCGAADAEGAGGGAGGAGARAARGVCSGDSGGPVLYRNVQVGVTSLGPVECARAGSTVPTGASSVFTALAPYADVVAATVADAEEALRMQRIGRAPPFTATLLTPLLPAIILLPAR